MKAQADTKRSEREFQVGDMVYLKLQPHIQSSVASRSNQKLAFKYYGTFKVLHMIGVVAYKLALHDHAKIHPVVHVSQLKKHIAPTEAISTDLSTVCVDPTVLPVPVAVIQRALKGKGGRMAMRTLVQWNSPSQLQTWEDEQDLQRRFPSAPAWGQAAIQAGGTVMNNKSMKKKRRLLERRARRREQERTSADMIREE
jgi:hypothetical protein